MADLTIGGAVRASGHTVRIRPSVRVFGSARLVWGQFLLGSKYPHNVEHSENRYYSLYSE
jgi:hypothetical protein